MLTGLNSLFDTMAASLEFCGVPGALFQWRTSWWIQTKSCTLRFAMPHWLLMDFSFLCSTSHLTLLNHLKKKKNHNKTTLISHNNLQIKYTVSNLIIYEFYSLHFLCFRHHTQSMLVPYLSTIFGWFLFLSSHLWLTIVYIQLCHMKTNLKFPFKLCNVIQIPGLFWIWCTKT